MIQDHSLGKPFYATAYLLLKRLVGISLFRTKVANGPITDQEAFIELLKCIFGTGCLAMPKGFANVGWLVGLISTVIFGGIMAQSVQMLLKDKIKLTKLYNVPMLSYSDTIDLAMRNGPIIFRPLSTLMGYQVDFFLCFSHFGVNCVYISFVAKNLKTLGDMYIKPMDTRIYMAFLTIPLLLIFLIRSLKYLVPFAITANCLMLVGFIFALHYMNCELPNLLEEREAFKDWKQIPIFFGTLMFSIEALGMILTVHAHMINPDHYLGFNGILNRAFAAVVLFYMFFGLMGYWKYGDDTMGSVLSNIPNDETFGQLAIIVFSIAIVLSYPLSGYVSIDIIWHEYLEPNFSDNHWISMEFPIRMAMVIASVLCAIAFPDFELLLAFVGSLFLSHLALIYPGIINICVCYSEGYGPCNFLLWRSLLIIFIGLIGGITGSMSSLTTWREMTE